jgi:hypothetical protein
VSGVVGVLLGGALKGAVYVNVIEMEGAREGCCDVKRRIE